mmetsp:Transcript_34092/g.80345  ORF Transcript_34092/g.80345 Transcript_34092/m.80345 type:complete len:131 (-) Transcript_34092:823-1215(-)
MPAVRRRVFDHLIVKSPGSWVSNACALRRANNAGTLASKSRFAAARPLAEMGGATLLLAAGIARAAGVTAGLGVPVTLMGLPATLMGVLGAARGCWRARGRRVPGCCGHPALIGECCGHKALMGEHASKL